MKSYHALQSASYRGLVVKKSPPTSSNLSILAAKGSRRPRPLTALPGGGHLGRPDHTLSNAWSHALPRSSGSSISKGGHQPGVYQQVESTYEPPEDSEHGRIRYEELVHRFEHHRIARVSIANPKKGNSLNLSLLTSLITVLRRVSANEELRCLILGGEARSFCTGMDIGEMRSLNNPKRAAELITKVGEACQAVRDVPFVTIGSVQGNAMGAGLEVLAACDFRLALADAVFAMPETRLGIPSVVHARLLANVVGWQHTKRLTYLGESVYADEAHSMGLIDAPPADSGARLASEVLHLATRVARNAPRAMRAQKRLVRLWEEEDLRVGIDAGVEAFAGTFADGGEEPKEYMGLFLARRSKSKQTKVQGVKPTEEHKE